MDRRQERKDLAYRRRMWRAVAITLALGALVLLGLDAWLDRLALQGTADPQGAMSQAAYLALAVQMAIIIVCLVLARLLLGWARQTREQGQWPPAGVELPGGRMVRHGDDARRIAGRLRASGYVALVIAAGQAAWTAGRWLG